MRCSRGGTWGGVGGGGCTASAKYVISSIGGGSDGGGGDGGAGDGDGGQASFAERFREVEHNVHGGQFGLHVLLHDI